ncbi:30S ribosomal protein S18 [Deferribacteraceae bacterium V6Fe1]|jgi:small subunit ribosomal protein S18|uniref:30S ribosomal protein S18 n=1 Tax=Deferrivibrio essentukiensis TaxID=2880922 RepID=UPI0019BD9FF0|nr:30S ribosomal protein S18 [Deferrivibrio essentukiensis]MBC7196916.1 30S ribosomal protein S18 [Deferribacterales bacterium]MBZ4672964.1 ribosomal protein [Deferribacteraceae bacterium]MCB4203709.1 30S ribosomal protein S18 [Deferrivibrio essentukiensis]UOD35008.1 30S ribosomal protein S18 [Deferribacteraceae bacterium V6Fe1]
MSFKKKFQKKKVCRFCSDKLDIDYKDSNLLRQFVTERGKIMPSRLTGTCAKHQRKLASAVKTARIVALLPFTLSK